MADFRSSPATGLGTETALPGRAEPMRISGTHVVLGSSMTPPFPDGSERIDLGMGCFWGSEEIYWQMPGVITTAVGYGGGVTPNPSYEEVCSGLTGHTELTLVVWDPDLLSLTQVLAAFWEQHDPTQGMRQGNDVGTQYRSAVYTHSEAQLEAALRSASAYQTVLTGEGRGAITTEISPAGPFYYAEEHHQQYLAKNPYGYRCHARSGVDFPVAAFEAMSV